MMYQYIVNEKKKKKKEPMGKNTIAF